MSPQDLPLVNACLNTLTTCLLIAGFVAIKMERKDTHRKLMVSAFCTSALFLVGYLIHKFTVGPTSFQGQGTIRWIYFTILITHTILAIVNLPMIIWTLTLAIRGKFEAHRKLARWAYPIWMYVSVTGVLVYLFLYQWFG